MALGCECGSHLRLKPQMHLVEWADHLQASPFKAGSFLRLLILNNVSTPGSPELTHRQRFPAEAPGVRSHTLYSGKR